MDKLSDVGAFVWLMQKASNCGCTMSNVFQGWDRTWSVSVSVRDGVQFIPKPNGTYHSMLGPAAWECRIAEQYGLYVLKGVYPTKKMVACQTCVFPDMHFMHRTWDMIAPRGECGMRGWAPREDCF
jgi:hypothetical protein